MLLVLKQSGDLPMAAGSLFSLKNGSGRGAVKCFKKLKTKIKPTKQKTTGKSYSHYYTVLICYRVLEGCGY